MTEEVKEPKDLDVSTEVDNFLDTEGEQAPQESSPETPEPEQPKEDGSDPAKTPSTEAEPSGDTEAPKDKGFADHPKWIERENKLKEAQRKLEDYERQQQQYAWIQKDPEAYEKHLRRQGYSDFEIQQQLRQAGFPPKRDESKQESMLEFVAKKKGWNLETANQDQIAYLRDLSEMAEMIAEKKAQDLISPIQRRLDESHASQDLNDSLSEVKQVAETEGIEWKIAQTAMSKTLQELDANQNVRLPRNERGQVIIDPMSLYQRSTRQLILERSKAKESQEQRNGAKKLATPLRPGASTPTPDSSKFKGKSPSEITDAFLDEVGYKD